jgi:hypothetical protein
MRRLRSVSNAALFFPLVWSFVASAFPQPNPQSEAYVPATRLDLAVVGYRELSVMARRSGAANLSLNFLDHDHVLFTFNPKKLFARLPDCPSTHDDRMVHAAVFEASSGKLLQERDWYLHDSRRYLWPLGSGKVLLRRLNSLYTVDSELHEKLLLTSPQDVLWTSVTPDGKQIILEVADDSPAPNSKGRPARKRTRIEFLDSVSLAVQRVIRSEKSVNLEGTSSGFASVTPGLSGKVWLVRFGASEQGRANIARVRSRCAPDILYLSSNTLLIGRDSASAKGYSVSAFTVTGNRLWRQHWQGHRYAPVVAPSEDGSRFVISTLRLIDGPTPDAENDEPGPDKEGPDKEGPDKEGLEQRIQVLDTASGDAVLSLVVSPVILGGQNFSLAPDGSHLVLLHGTTLEFYDLPQMSADERARYTAVRADVPGLYIPASEAASADTDSEPVFTAAADEPQSVTANEASSNSNGLAEADAAATDQPPAVPAVPTMMPGQPATTSMPAFKSHAQVVALDVVVADANGHSIKGLPRQRFVVKEDGRAQAITYFDEVTGGKPAAEPAPAIEKNELPSNIFTNESHIPDSSSVTLILYDLLNTPAVEQQRAKLELLKFLENKPKDSKFALCVLSEKLQMIQGFTPDETLLVKATKAQKGSLRYTSMLSQDEQSQQTVDWLTQGSMSLLATSSKFAAAATSMLDTAGKFEQRNPSAALATLKPVCGSQWMPSHSWPATWPQSRGERV